MKKLIIIALILFTACNNSGAKEENQTPTEQINQSETTNNEIKEDEEKDKNVSSDEEPEAIENFGKIDNSNTKIAMMTQEYIDENIAEIPMISYDWGAPEFSEYGGKNPEIEALNNSIKFGLQMIYNDFMDSGAEGSIEIRTYPFTDDKYLQMVSTYVTYPSYGTDGNITSYNFDKEENKFMALDDVINDANLTREDISEGIKELFEPEAEGDFVSEVSTTGFLIQNGYTQFLNEVTVENPEAEPWVYFYSYYPETKELIRLNNYCLFDPYSMDMMEPPLAYGQNLD